MQPTEDDSSTVFEDIAGNVLVVDDQPESLELILAVLENEPVKIFTAQNGQGALHELQNRPFDLLLLDISLPDMNGFEVCRKVKSHSDWHVTKVIMVSASDAIEDKLLAFDVGADDYVTKPLPLREFKARVQLMLRLRRAERELTQRNSQLEELIHISEQLNRRLNFEDTVKAVVQSAVRLVGADGSTLSLWDEEQRYHRIVATENEANPILGMIIPEEVGLVGMVYKLGRLCVIPDYQSFENRISTLDVLNKSRETAAVPLRIGDRHIGVLVVSLIDPENHFRPSDIDILTTLANQAAIAIENARLYTELGRETERYRLIAEKASDLIISVDGAGNLVYVNERVQTVLGYAPSEMINQPFSKFLMTEGQIVLNELLHNWYQPMSEAEVGEIIRPANQLHELLAYSKDGAPINLEFSFGPLYRQNQLTSIQGIGRDVTARRRSEETERMRVIGQIAGGVAHDLNNMLANVLGHAQLLKIETSDSRVLQTIQIIEQSALDGAETVRRIQEFTAQRMPQALDVLNLNTVVQSTIDLNRPRWRDEAQHKGMKIQVERELQNIPSVRGNAAEMREVLINLFNNAIDAMPPQGGQIGFRTYLDPTGQMVCLDVWDTGYGMPAEVMRHIFEPLYTTKGVGGTGLGLSVARTIIVRFGGELSVESIPGVGTTFLIKLPAVIALVEKVASVANDKPAVKTLPIFKGRILIVDDEPNLRHILRRALSLVGFTVEAAESGPEALELLSQAAAKLPEKALPFDLIFSDLGMPEMSGWELAQEVNRYYPGLPLVLVTGWGDQLNPERMAELNVVRTIAKPFNIQDLINLAAALISDKK